MSRNLATFAWSALAVICAAICIGASGGGAKPAASPPVENLLPADAIAYIGWDGSEDHAEAWKQTAAYKSLYESGLVDVFKKVIVMVLRRSGQDETEFLGAYNTISRNGLSLAITLPSDSPLPIPRVVVVLHEGKEFLPLLNRLVNEAVSGEVEFATRDVESRKVTSAIVPNSPGVEIGWWAEAEHLVIAGGIDAVNSTIAVATGDAANITQDSLWTRYPKTDAGFEVSLVSWLNLGAVRDHFAETPLPIPSRTGQPLKVSEVVQLLGLDTAGAVVHRSGYKQKALRSETLLEAPAKRTGLLSFADQEPISLDDLPPLPANASGFFAQSIDWSKTHDDLIQLLRGATAVTPPVALVQLEVMLDQLPAQLGFDLKTDLLDHLGNVVCAYSDNNPSVFAMDLSIALQVEDAEPVRRIVNQLLGRLAAIANNQVLIKQHEKLGRNIIVFEAPDLPVLSPALVVDDNWMAVGLSPQSVESFLLRLDGKLPVWEPTAEHREALAALPSRFNSIVVSDPRQTIRAMLGFAPMLMGFMQSEMNSSNRGGPVQDRTTISASDIPPAELVIQPLFPNLSVCTVDDRGVRWQSRTSVPSIPLLPGLGGGSGVASTGVLMALLLPAVQQARSAARRTQSKNNLKQMGIALHNHNDVHSSFPQGAAPHQDLKPEKRLSWMAAILPFMDQGILHDQIDFEKGWEDNVNAELMKTVLPVYQNPGTSQPESKFATTHYVGIAGLGKEGPTLPAKHKRAGIFAYNRVTRIQDITDGTSNTAMVSEASKDFGPWGAGGKSTIRALINKPYINGPDGIGGPSTNGCSVLFADGAVRFISKDIDPIVMEHLAAMADGHAVNRP